jgi:serine phosphatase RsbU (regulator of sigma subunit)
MPRPEGQRTHPVRLRLAALAVICALVLGGASIALAKPGHGNGNEGSTQEASVGFGQGGGEGNGHGHGGQGGGEGKGQGHGQGGGEGNGHGHGAQNSGEGNGHGTESPSSSEGNGQAHSAQATGKGNGNGKGHASEGNGQASEGKGKGKGHASEGNGQASESKGKGKGNGNGQAGEAAGTPHGRQSHLRLNPAGNVRGNSAGSASMQAVAASPVTAATNAAPTAAVAPQAVSRSSASRHARAVRRSHLRRASGSRHGPRRRGRSSAPITLTHALAAIPLTSGASGNPGVSAHGKGASPRTNHTTHASTQPPIVQTITKIVGVVPLAVWIAGGALLAIALALAAGSRLLAKRARRLERQRGELLADVGLLQGALMPVPPAGPGPVSASVAYRPADGPAAGGDFYDVFALEDGRLATIVGDVSGHGREALPHTALVRFTLRAYLEAGLSPREALRTAGAVLERQLEGALVSAVLATYQPRERTLVYACAGHPPPIVLGTRELAPVGASSSPPLGTGLPTGTRQTVLSLPGAAQVCFHTDGVTDARVGQDLYGSQRLAAALASLGPAASAPALLDRVAEQTDARPDDMAACLLSLQGGPAQPVTLVQELELWSDETARERAERFLLACGLTLSASATLASKACEQADGVGSVLIEARPAGPGAGAPSARIRDDLPDIHASDTRRLATVGGAR